FRAGPRPLFPVVRTVACGRHGCFCIRSSVASELPSLTIIISSKAGCCATSESSASSIYCSTLKAGTTTDNVVACFAIKTSTEPDIPEYVCDRTLYSCANISRPDSLTNPLAKHADPPSQYV